MRTSRVGLLHVCQNLLCIALQVTNIHVYLSKCHSKRYDIHEKNPFSFECIKGVSLDGDAAISVARSTIYRYRLPGVSAVHAPTQGSNPGFTRGRLDHGHHKRARRSHRLLRFLVALYCQWADLAVTFTFLYYTNFDLRWIRLPVDLAFLAYALALVRHVTADRSPYFWFCSGPLRCSYTLKL